MCKDKSSHNQQFNNWLAGFLQDENCDKSVKDNFYFVPFIEFKTYRKQTGKFYIYEDWWISRPEVVKSKITSIIGKSMKVYARKCEVIQIDKPIADEFFENNHIYGSVSSKFHLGLFYEKSLVACASFSKPRNLKVGKSGELLRFCTQNNISVTGGLSKLLQAYFKIKQTDNIMTYADLDWGSGSGFKKVGFINEGHKESMLFYCNLKTGKRILSQRFSDFNNINSYIEIYNKGSVKFVLSKK